MKNRDQYLKQTAGRNVFLYQRSIPKDLQHLHSGRKLISRTTGTNSVFEARKIRDELKKLDDEWFLALRAGENAETIREDYEATLSMRTALGTDFIEAKTFTEAIANGELAQFDKAARLVKKRIRGTDEPATREEIKKTLPTINAIRRLATGAVERPAMSTADVFAFWMEKRAYAEIKGKSREQLRQWRNPIERTRNHFTKLVGDKPFLEVTRNDARKFYDKLNERIIAGEISAHTGNREIGVLRKIWRDYAEYQGNDEINPFLNFRWKKEVNIRKSYSVDFLEKNFLHGTKMLGLNFEARAAVFVLIETGARPSEVINLRRESIVLDAEVPYIDIRPTSGRSLKNRTPGPSRWRRTGGDEDATRWLCKIH